MHSGSIQRGLVRGAGSPPGAPVLASIPVPARAARRPPPPSPNAPAHATRCSACRSARRSIGSPAAFDRFAGGDGDAARECDCGGGGLSSPSPTRGNSPSFCNQSLFPQAPIPLQVTPPSLSRCKQHRRAGLFTRPSPQRSQQPPRRRQPQCPHRQPTHLRCVMLRAAHEHRDVGRQYRRRPNARRDAIGNAVRERQRHVKRQPHGRSRRAPLQARRALRCRRCKLASGSEGDADNRRDAYANSSSADTGGKQNARRG
eukprot:211128-Chlamydomonas_euryale.AAC.3